MASGCTDSRSRKIWGRTGPIQGHRRGRIYGLFGEDLIQASAHNEQTLIFSAVRTGAQCDQFLSVLGGQTRIIERIVFDALTVFIEHFLV